MPCNDVFLITFITQSLNTAKVDVISIPAYINLELNARRIAFGSWLMRISLFGPSRLWRFRSEEPELPAASMQLPVHSKKVWRDDQPIDVVVVGDSSELSSTGSSGRGLLH